MTTRSASWSGSAGAAWPALSTGDAWGAGFWSSPNKTVEQYDSITSTVNGSGSGSIALNANRPAWPVVITQVSSTAASTSGRYLLNSAGPAVGTLNLVYVCTTWTASHYHQVAPASCSGGWLNLTYDLVTSYEWSNAGIFFKMSVFRTVSGAANAGGNIAVDIYDTATSSIIATQATGSNMATISVYGVDTTSNGANAIRTTNNTTATNTTGQPAVTLPNNLLKYSSTPLAFFASAANTPTFTGITADSRNVANGSYVTPANAMGIYARTQPSTVATVKTQRTVTGGFSISNVKWGAIGIELLRSTAQDTYMDVLNDYTYARIANNTVQPQYQSAEVRASVADVANPFGPYTGLIGRYVVSGATKYWIGTHVVANALKAQGNAYIFAVVDNGTTSTVTGFAFSTGAANYYDSYDRMALRIRVLPSGDLWASAKYWASSAAEPSWPADSTTASTAQVINGVYSTNDALRNAAAGQVGLYQVTPSTSSPIFNSAAFYGTPDSTTTSWSSFTNSEWVVTGATSGITGGGTISATGTRIAQGSAAIAGGGSVAAAGKRIALGSATIAGGGSITAVGLHIDVAFAILDGGGSVTSSGLVIHPIEAAPADITLSSPPPSVSLVGVAEVATLSFTGQDGDISLLPITALANNANLATSSDLGSTTLAPLGVAATQAVLTFSPQLGTATCLAAAIGLPPQILFDAQLALIIQ